MSVTVPLNEMTLPEKLQLMETLWEDLSRNSDAVESPKWHADILQEREEQIQSGQAHFSSWEQARTNIRRQVS